MRSRISHSVVVLVASIAVLVCAAASAGTISSTTFTDDAGSGVSATTTYTHLLDMGNPNDTAATVNTVAFDKAGAKDVLSYSGTTTQGYGYTYETDDLGSYGLNYAGGQTSYIGVASGQGMYSLLTDMQYCHGEHNYAKLTLSDLDVGTTYNAKIYYRSWGPYTRDVKVQFDYGNGTVYETPVFNEDALADPYVATILSFEYTATSAGNLTINIVPSDTDAGFHFYGMSNEVVAVPEPGGLALLACGLFGLLAYAWRKRK